MLAKLIVILSSRSLELLGRRSRHTGAEACTAVTNTAPCRCHSKAAALGGHVKAHTQESCLSQLVLMCVHGPWPSHHVAHSDLAVAVGEASGSGRVGIVVLALQQGASHGWLAEVRGWRQAMLR